MFKKKSLEIFNKNPIIYEELTEKNYFDFYKEGVLKDLRNIQYYCQNGKMKEGFKFDFKNFLKKLMDIKIDDIEDINIDIIDTLDYINYYQNKNMLDHKLLNNFYQIRICSNFLNQLIECKKNEEGLFSGMKINNEDLLKFPKFKPVISKLNLLIKLIEENLYEENISYQLFNPNISNILSSILKFEEKRNNVH